jgi:hypothetical protein
MPGAREATPAFGLNGRSRAPLPCAHGDSLPWRAKVRIARKPPPATMGGTDMSPTRITIVLGAAIVFLAVQGCETPSARLPPPKSTVTLVLKPGERNVPGTVPLGSALKIVLPPPSQGPSYAWEILSNNTRVLRQTSPVEAEVDAGGRAASYSVVFQATRVSPPRSVVTIAAVRPGAAESESSDIYQVTVSVEAPAQP